MKDLNSLIVDELHGILMTYEMRTDKQNTAKIQRIRRTNNKKQVIVPTVNQMKMNHTLLGYLDT